MTDIYDLVSCIHCGAVLDRDYLKDYKKLGTEHTGLEISFTCPVCKGKNERFW